MVRGKNDEVAVQTDCRDRHRRCDGGDDCGRGGVILKLLKKSFRFKLCQKRNCLRALAYGCYRWLHDQMLREIEDVISTTIQSSKYHPMKKDISFLRAGEKSNS
ncbi:Hypothetical predicted protein [Octopus vulgaris]|uniref:Uncharacterized protein n=1 Tax=Octopus vulgaris TaxID=6645 RepID=A0AA36B8L4_OCTVU|nr:Hypothetical predicted protein [Octopus vulgaris]